MVFVDSISKANLRARFTPGRVNISPSGLSDLSTKPAEGLKLFLRPVR